MKKLLLATSAALIALPVMAQAQMQPNPGIYRGNLATVQAAPVGFQQFTAGANINQTAIMANLLYDFRLGWPIVPYIGAGAGIAFVNASALGGSTSSTQFAYQGIIGVGYEIDQNWRINIDGRYFGTTNPTINNPLIGGVTYNNNNISLMASLQYKFGAPSVRPPPPPTPSVAPPSFIAFSHCHPPNLSHPPPTTTHH